MIREVSEKTLEINVCAEILADIRSRPGCGAAYWIGMKQDQEYRNGLDDLLRNAPGVHLMLQFKSPSPKSPDTLPYSFAIGGKQLSCLRSLAALHPSAVHYVFPFFNTLRRLQAASPNLLSDTWFLPVRRIPRGNHHRAECRAGAAIIFSDPKKEPLQDWKGVTEHWNTIRRESIPSKTLLDWVHDVSEKFQGPQAGQILRGLGTIYFPLPEHHEPESQPKNS